MLESGEPTDEVVKPEVPAVAEGETATQTVEGTRHASNGNGHVETLPPRKSRKERAIERATADLRRENEELRRQVGAGKTTAPKDETPNETPKPKRADFAQDEAGQEAFEDALVAWGNEKFAVEQALSSAQIAEQRHLERNLKNYAAQLEEAKEAHDDWDELEEKFKANDVFIGHATQIAILEMANGPEITYHLMRNPEKAAELGRMSQGAAFAEVVRLSDRLKTGEPAHNGSGGEEYEYRRPRPKVPAPVRTVSTGGPSGNPTFAEIAARPNYPGKARDLKRALAQRGG